LEQLEAGPSEPNQASSETLEPAVIDVTVSETAEHTGADAKPLDTAEPAREMSTPAPAELASKEPEQR
jgi:hypothetical protein